MLVTISRPPPIVCTCRMTNITDTFAAFQITTTFSVFGTFTVTLVAGLVARGGVIQGKAGGALGLLGCIVWGRGCWLGVCLLERKGNTYTVFGTWQGVSQGDAGCDGEEEEEGEESHNSTSRELGLKWWRN